MSDHRHDFTHRSNDEEAMQRAVEACWKEMWEPIIVAAHERAEEANDIGLLESADGGFSRAELEQVKSELYDFHTLMQNVTRVYCEITGGQISKPLTDPEAVISESQEVGQKHTLLDVLELFDVAFMHDDEPPANQHPAQYAIDLIKKNYGGLDE
jgi:hypothetical protein